MLAWCLPSRTLCWPERFVGQDALLTRTLSGKTRRATTGSQASREYRSTMKQVGSAVWGEERVLLLAPATVLLFAVTIISLDPLGLATRLRDYGFDRLQNTFASGEAFDAPLVTLVEIDNASLQQLGDWPWPRTRYADLIAEAEVAGARAILVADGLSRPDPTSPAVVTRHVDGFAATMPAVQDAALSSEHDAALADTLSFSRAVIPVDVARSWDEEAGEPTDLSWAQAGALPVTEETQAFFPALRVTDAPLPIYTEIGVTFGFDSVIPDEDGVLRTVPLAARIGERVVASDILEVIRLADGSDAIDIQSTGMATRFSVVERNGLNSISLGGRVVPVRADGALRYLARDADRLPRMPAWRLISDPMTRSMLTDRIVVIAPTARGTVQRLVTPDGTRLTPGEVKALALNQILTGAFLTRPDWAPTLEDGLVIGLGLALVGLLAAGRAGIAIGLAALSLPILGALSWYAYTRHGVLFDALVPGLALGLLGLAMVWVLFAERFARRQRLIQALQTKLPRAAAASLASKKGRAQLAGEVRRITALSCGLRHVDGFADANRDDPVWLTSQIQRFHGYLVERITAAGGVADIRDGTRVLGLWNAPQEIPDHARQACDCALKLMDGLEQLNIEIEHEAEGRSFVQLDLAVGINTGQAFVGNLGTADRLDYTALGAPVRSARWLQDCAEVYGTSIVVGETCHNFVKSHYAFLEVDRVDLDGSGQGLRTYTLIGNPVLRANPRFKALQAVHDALLEAYRAQDWSGVREQVAKAGAMQGSIPALLAFYERRARFFETYPPGRQWDGTFTVPIQ